MIRFVLLLFFIAITCLNSSAQIVLNEGSNKNYTQVASPTGKFNDWLELYNLGNQSINLLGYYLSDDVKDLQKWNFPETAIAPGNFALVFASGDGVKNPIHHWETAIYDSSLWSYYVPADALNEAWYLPGYDASSWLKGKGGIGFGDNDDSTVITTGSISVYMIHNFIIPDLSKIVSAVLHVDYDDGFVAYLNGIEIARKNLSGTPPVWDEQAMNHEAKMYSGGKPETFNIDSAIFVSAIKNDSNVLAIEIHNASTGSNDLTARPFLSFGIADTSSFFGSAPSFVIENTNTTLETNFKIDAAGETIYLTDPALNIIDSLYVGNLALDYSTGKFPDGINPNGFFQIATPGSSNNSSSFYTGYEPAPVVSPDAGFFTGTQTILITTTSPTAEIRYTINGTDPNSTSALYTSSFQLDSSHVVKAKCFSTAGLLPSTSTTHTLFINETFSLPVISITTDSLNLWGVNGICDNWWEDWKKPCYIEYFDTSGINNFRQRSSLKIDGGAGGSRSQPQHSFRLDADNNALGDGPFQYPLIPDREKRKEYESIYLRNGSNMYLGLFYKDALQCKIFRDTYTNYQEYTPTVVFINGEYWGVYELREKQDAGYFKQNFDTNSDSLDLLSLSYWYGSVLRTLSGSDEDFYVMHDKIVNGDPLDSNYFAMADSMLDLASYADYIIAQTWHGNYDWPGNNIKIWRSRSSSNKWRFGLIDLENGMQPWGWSDASSNLIAYLLNYDPNNLYVSPWQTLVKNKEFHDYFINRYADLMNTKLLGDSIEPIADKVYNEVYDAMPRNYERWGDTINNTVQDYMDQLYSLQSQFVTGMKQRLNNTRKHLKGVNGFNLVDTVGYALDINPPGAGRIKISTIKPANYPWSGVYFEGVPVTLTVIPNPGYLFNYWSGNSFITDTTLQTITVDPTSAGKYVANFIATGPVKLIVNEFNFDSEPSISSGDWIEIYNNGSDAVELTDWYFKDDNDEHKFEFPAGKKLLAGEILVVVSDSLKFKEQNPATTNWIGEMGFGLNGSGDMIRLFSTLGDEVEKIAFTDSLPWPQGCAGEGRTAERLNPDSSAGKPLNWFDGCVGGSPGELYAPCNYGIVKSEIK
ncbi:MAG: lamin tail domain-containing protein [Chitinophagales bacterium]|nr:lamin tail domain-containing protein [Chitinophagales bacterium]